MGLVKVPGTNYYVVDPVKFQDWFKSYVELKNNERKYENNKEYKRNT